MQLAMLTASQELALPLAGLLGPLRHAVFPVIQRHDFGIAGGVAFFEKAGLLRTSVL